MSDPPSAPPDALLQAVFEASSEALGVACDGIIEAVNPAFLDLFGYADASELVGRPLGALVSPSSAERVDEYTERRRRGQTVPGLHVFEAVRKDGSTFTMEVRASPVRTGPERRVVAVARDITEARRAEQELRESEEFYRSLFEGHSAVKLLIDAETGRIEDANESAAALYGWSVAELRERAVYDLNTNPAEDVKRALVAAGAGRLRYFRARHRVRDGSMREVEVYTSPVPWRGRTLLLSVIHDVTDRAELEERLRQSQKMEAVGRLAGGIAHDFNNLLTVMLGYGELTLAELPHDAPAREHVEAVLMAASRARDLTRQLLAFSRRQVLQPRAVHVNDVVRSIEAILRRTLAGAVELAIELAPEAPAVMADPGQLEQVLMNLCINARDAMPQGGVLRVRTDRLLLHGPDPAWPDARPGMWCRLRVSDTGVGMSETVKARLFEPFFTTKGVGEGTGLGLAIVYGVVKQSSGHISVHSTEGRGSTFELLLPAIDAPAELPTLPPLQAPAIAPAAGRRLLLVEDEPGIRELFGVWLRRAGWEVEEAEDALQALERCGEEGVPYQVVVSDVVMPGMTGIQLAQELQRRSRGLPVLLVSGDVRVPSQITLGPTLQFLQKPVSGPALVAAVARAVTLVE